MAAIQLHSVNVCVFPHTHHSNNTQSNEWVVTVCFPKEKMVPLMREGEAGERAANKGHSKYVQMQLMRSLCKQLKMENECPRLVALAAFTCGTERHQVISTDKEQQQQQQKTRLPSPFSESIFKFILLFYS